MKLLVEAKDSIETIVESVEGEKQHYIKGIFMQAELKNRNGRVYPRQVMEKALGEFLPMVESKRAVGCLEHEPTPAITLDRVSHLIESLEFDGNNVIGKARILDTPCGKIAKAMIEGGVQLGVSTRGVGSIKFRNGLNEVQNDFKLATVDIVHQPSGIDCFVDGIMESADWVMDADGKWHMVESLQANMKNMSSVEIEAKKYQLFEEFMDIISGKRR